MRVAFAGFLHETNTFAPTPADLKAFQLGGGYVPMVRGAELIDAFHEVNLGMTGALKVAKSEDWEVVPILWAGAIPSAHVKKEAFEEIAEAIVSGFRDAGPLDGVFLDLHGAMVADHLDDGEAEIAARVRAVVGPDVPIVAALDLHGNISETFVDLVDALVGFRTYPHVDMADTGARAARLLAGMMESGTRPAKAFRQMSYLVPIPFQSTDMSPARELYAALDDIDENGSLSTSLFMGFPAADIPDCGPTAMAFAKTQAEADRAADQIADAYEEVRMHFDNKTFSPDEAVVEAMFLGAGEGQGPVVIADTQDNPGAGGVSATTGLLRALIKAKAQDAAIGLIVDPKSAAQAHAAGVGATAQFDLGGHPGVPGDAPVVVNALVETLTDGVVHATGPYYGGTVIDLGPSVCLRIDGVRVVVTSRIAQMADREMFRFVGIQPEEMRILVVKSSTHFRADFSPVARDILVALAPGPMPFEPSDLPFTKLRQGLRLGPNGPIFGASETKSVIPEPGEIETVRTDLNHKRNQQGKETC